MKKLLWIGLLVFSLMPVSANAQSALDGTWKINMSTAKFSDKPDVYLLEGGMYSCKTCVPKYEIKADGQDQKITGHPYFDTLSVKVVDDKTLEMTTKKAGKVVGGSKWVISPDGNTLTVEFTDSSATNADPVTGKAESTRVEKGPAGAHSISGSWRTSKLDTVSDNGLLWTFKVDGETLNMTTPTGQSYAAKLDGTDAPYKGDPGTTSVSVKKIGKNGVEEMDKRDGKVVVVSRMVVDADGKTMSIENIDKLHGTTNKFTATKQ
jgi:hypothetical protein